MSLTRIHNLSISLDGFATGEPQSAEAPFGHAGQRLHEWMIATRFWDAGGTDGVDNAFAQRHGPGIGAEIMGANKFGPPGWQDDPDWRGWWGPNPPFHTPTFVLTHRPRPSIEMEGGTTFHFLEAAPARGARNRPRGSRRPGRPDRRRPHRRARLPRRRARRPHACGPGPDPARPRCPPLGRSRGTRGVLRHRDGFLPQRRHPPHLHPQGHLVNLEHKRVKRVVKRRLIGEPRVDQDFVCKWPNDRDMVGAPPAEAAAVDPAANRLGLAMRHASRQIGGTPPVYCLTSPSRTAPPQWPHPDQPLFGSRSGS